MAKNPISYEEFNLENNVTVYAVNIKKLNKVLRKYLDKKLVKICKGKREIPLTTVKKEFIHYLETKNNSKLLTGSVSEFFIHLFIGSQKFKQEFLYFNLEENSMKKGFDGYYTKDLDEWILESKSTRNLTNKHNILIAKAYRGVKDKIEGVDKKNNPWENAYSHANHGDVKAKKHVTDKLNTLSQLYTEKIYSKVEDFNIIASSTIFLENDYKDIDIQELVPEFKNYLANKKFRKIIIICLNKKSIHHLKDYLKL